MAKLPIYRYCLDDSDRFVWVDEWWCAFARENGAPELNESAVLGQELWGFIAGDLTRKMYGEIHRRVRLRNLAVVIPFRCDSPSLQRHMRLRITSSGDGRILYESVLLKAVPRPYLRLVDLDQPRGDSMLTICSCCKRGLIETHGWLELEDVVARLRLFDTPELPELRNTICPQCAAMANDSPDNGTAA